MDQVLFSSFNCTDTEIEELRSLFPDNFEHNVAQMFMNPYYNSLHFTNISRGEKWLRLGASKNNLKCLKWLNIEIIKDVIKGDKRQAIEYLCNLKNDYTIQTRLLMIDGLSSDLIVDEFFIYGRLIMLGKELNIGSEKPLQIYRKTVQKVKKAIFCFLWICKKFLCKDLRILIGKKIWESRFQAGTVWGSSSFLQL
jgi:hypothetical protein